MSSQKTENLGLHTWVPDDYVQMGEFNENFEKIDEKTGELLNISQEANDKVLEISEQLAGKATKSYVDLKGQYSDILTPVGHTRFIAHRGYNAIAPEGTAPSIIAAKELGLWSAEGDAQITADGHWVVFHDATVDRMTNGTGRVDSLTLAQLKELDIDSGNNIAYYPNLKIPTLEEFLLTCRENNITPCIELKSDTYDSHYTPEQYDSFISTIRKCGVENKILVQGSEPLCTQIRNRSKAIPLMLFTNFTNLNSWAGNYIQSSGNMMLNTDNKYVTSKSDIELAHSMGILVSVFVVDDVNRALELSSWGVDFIMTNALTGVIS